MKTITTVIDGDEYGSRIPDGMGDIVNIVPACIPLLLSPHLH